MPRRNLLDTPLAFADTFGTEDPGVLVTFDGTAHATEQASIFDAIAAESETVTLDCGCEYDADDPALESDDCPRCMRAYQSFIRQIGGIR